MPLLDVVGNPPRRLILTKFTNLDRKKAVQPLGASVTKAGITYPPDELVVQLLKHEFGEALELSDVCSTWFEQRVESRHELEDFQLGLKRYFDPPDEPIYKALKPYQRWQLQYGVAARRFINADDRGLGKTLEAISVAVAAGAARVLVVVPGYLKLNWVREIQAWTSASVFVARGERSLREKTIEQVQKFDKLEMSFLIVNYEMLRPKKQSGGYPELFEMPWDCVVFDEAHRLKNRTNQWVEGAKAVTAKTEYVQMLTGNPIDGSPDDIWNLLHLLYPRQYSGYWAFVEYFCNIVDNFFGKEVAGVNSKRMAQLQYELKPYVIRRLKSEVAPELPDKVYHEIHVELEGSQKRFYERLEKDMVIELENGDLELVPQLTAKHLRLQQALANPALLGGANCSIVEKTCLDLLGDLFEEFRKVIVGTWFVEAADRLEQLIGEKVKVFRVRSEQKDVQRDEVVERFKKCPDPCVLVGTIRTMSEGLNIDECDVEIFCDKAWTPLPNEQFEDRIHRINSIRQKHYYSIVVDNTISEDREEVLSRRVTDRDEIWAMTEVSRKMIDRNHSNFS